MPTRKPIRVLHVVGGMDRGGVETWLVHVLRCVDPARIRFDFLVHTDRACAYDDDLRALGARIFHCPGHRNLPSYARRFRRILAQHGPFDVVHSHVHRFSGFVLWLARRAHVGSRIAHSHATHDRNGVRPFPWPRRLYTRLADRLLRAHCTGGVAASESAAVALFGSAWTSDARFRVLHCGIDLGPFAVRQDRDCVRSELGLDDTLVLGHVGRFVPSKNHGFLLRVAAEVIAQAPHTRILLVGDGPTRPETEAQARELGIASRVSFLRVRTDVPRILAGATDAFVFPSTSEGLGLALVEAQAAGLPCFYSDTIPSEVAIVHDLLHPLSLHDPASTWAREILSNAPRRLARQPALDRVAASPFNITTSAARLMATYESHFVG